MPRATVKKAADTSKQLPCPMPGVITQILVKNGDEVEAGQSLARVEAMKMETCSGRREGPRQVRERNGWPVAGRRQIIMEFE
ncbi:hypothetical protein ATC00_24295 [Sinorhizobium americanum]|nr:hypothetical protein ATC00_24295 [Sinorhizobium americanum]